MEETQVSTRKRPKVEGRFANEELDKADAQFEAFDKQVKDLTLDRMKAAPLDEKEPQTKLSQKEIANSKDIYLKPRRTVSSREKFNEDYREQYNFAKEYVQFIAENKEIIGENIELWIKKFPGLPAEEWVIPVNKPVWGPRYLAEQIKNCQYSRMTMKQDVVTSDDGYGKYYGTMVVDTKIQRLDAYPVRGQHSIF
jgi:hypothetical protein